MAPTHTHTDTWPHHQIGKNRRQEDLGKKLHTCTHVLFRHTQVLTHTHKRAHAILPATACNCLQPTAFSISLFLSRLVRPGPLSRHPHCCSVTPHPRVAPTNCCCCCCHRHAPCAAAVQADRRQNGSPSRPAKHITSSRAPPSRFFATIESLPLPGS